MPPMLDRPIGIKVCTLCHRRRDLTCFYSKGKGAFQSRCKDCMRPAHKAPKKLVMDYTRGVVQQITPEGTRELPMSRKHPEGLNPATIGILLYQGYRLIEVGANEVSA